MPRMEECGTSILYVLCESRCVAFMHVWYRQGSSVHVLAGSRECLDAIKIFSCMGILLGGERILVFDCFLFAPWVASLFWFLC